MKFKRNIVSLIILVILFLFFKSTPVIVKSIIKPAVTCELKEQNTNSQDGNSTLVFEDNENFNYKKKYQLIKSILTITGDYFFFYQIYSSKKLNLITKISYLQKINLWLYYCFFRI